MMLLLQPSCSSDVRLEQAELSREVGDEAA